ncbi:SET domain-containing protein 3, partial [Pseudolycoriella hygida]
IDNKVGSRLRRDTYINRAKIYYESNHFQHALDNFDRAVEAQPFEAGSVDYDDLTEMHRKCKDHVLQGPAESSVMDLFGLSLPINEKLPFISDCVALDENEIYGRYIITKKDLSPGDVVVAEEPFFKQLTALCSSHTNEKTIMDFDFRDTDEANKKKLILSVSGLDKREPVNEASSDRFKNVFAQIYEDFGGAHSELVDFLTKCSLSLTVNFFHFFWSATDDAEPSGYALCALSAFFAHSCDPNVEKIDVDNKFVFVVKKPIKAGEQLSMCYDRYNFMKNSFYERQKYLKSVYNFECKCVACVDNYPRYHYEFNRQNITIKEAKERYRHNCELIKEKFAEYPNENLCAMMAENIYLLTNIGNNMHLSTGTTI